MPTYEYACTSCGTHVEVFQRFSEDPLTECGVCGGPLRKVFHPAGILFKGSGFYATDSRSSRSRSSHDTSPSSDDKAASSSEKTASSGDKTASSGDKSASSGEKTASSPSTPSKPSSSGATSKEKSA